MCSDGNNKDSEEEKLREYYKNGPIEGKNILRKVMKGHKKIQNIDSLLEKLQKPKISSNAQLEIFRDSDGYRKYREVKSFYEQMRNNLQETIAQLCITGVLEHGLGKLSVMQQFYLLYVSEEVPKEYRT